MPQHLDSLPGRQRSDSLQARSPSVTLPHDLVVELLEHRIELEALITTISTRFVNADPDNIGAEIATAIGQVGHYIGTDRALMYRLTSDGTQASLVQDWAAKPGVGVKKALPLIRRSDAPKVLDYFLARKSLNSPRPDTLPDGFALLNELPNTDPVISRISVPVIQGNRTVGILCFHSLTIERHWLDEDLRLLGLLGEIIGSALARAEADIALKQAKDEAEAANRAKSNFLTSMSHELRTPLNGILGYAQLLQRRQSLQATDRADVEVIQRCGEHLLTLINDVLDLARIESGRADIEVSVFALEDLLREVADIARVRSAAAGVHFTYTTNGTLPPLLATDSRKLRQVLLNLLGNAIKYTGDGGKVTLRVAGEALPDEVWRLRMEVEDTGCGIAEDNLQSIFEPFSIVRRPEQPIEGTGLGLSISRKLMQLMGGTLAVQSRLGEGSIFVVQIDAPSAALLTTEQRSSAATITGYRGDRRSVLIVDDSADNRGILRSLLEPIGFEVREATDGADAVTDIAERVPDLVFMDLVMPRLNGLDATRHLRTTFTATALPIVAVSADAYDVTRSNSESAGCNAFVTKPVRLDDVLAVAARLLHLDWTYQASPDRAAATTVGQFSADATALPAAVAAELLHLARMGDVDALTRRVRELPLDDPQMQAISNHLGHLAERYDLKRIRSLLSAVVSASVARTGS